jgi:hypothetical protein
MAYGESLFFLVIIVFLLGCQRKWPILVLAAIVGLATACRPVGVALIPPLYLHCWGQSPSLARFSLTGVAVAPLACWGLLAYMTYLQFTFGDALAFARTQENWAYRPGTWGERLGESLILKPIWSKYDPSSLNYWGRLEPTDNPLFSLDFANPLYFLVTCGLVAYGAWRKHLNGVEILLAAGLLLIPYFSHGHRSLMLGQARYALAAFPAFMVLGRILWQLPPPISGSLLAISGFFLGMYSALFAAWYRFF